MNKIILSLLIFLGVHAQAQKEVEGTTTGRLMRGADESMAPRGLAPFLGANVGYTDQATAVESEGMPSSLKLLGSYYLENQMAVFDLGYGIQNQQFSRNRALDGAVNAGALEAAARYHFANRWQAGAVMNQYFDVGANYGANQADAQFAGLQLLKEFSFKGNYIARAGARLMTDLNVDNKTVNMAMIDFQIGWNPNTKAVRGVKTSAQSQPKSAPVVRAEQKAMPAAETALEQATHFELNSAELTSAQQEYLRKLGKVLAANPGLVEEVQVTGHTDSIGNRALNSELSKKRALSVAEILKESSQGKAQIGTRGLADLYPVSSTQSQNRRAEIKFIGVKDQAKLDEILKSIE